MFCWERNGKAYITDSFPVSDTYSTPACARTSLADIVFLLDGSSSISPESFKEMLLFLQNFIQNLDVGADKVRVGVAQYSDQPYKEFLLKDHMDEASLLDQVSKIPHRQGGTFTGQAITFLQQTFFTPEGGSRAAQRVPQIAVVITDGDSSDDVIEPARKLRQKGVIVFAIAIGSSNSTNLHEIANRPHERFLFSINSYQALQQLLDRLLQILCVTVEDQRTGMVASPPHAPMNTNTNTHTCRHSGPHTHLFETKSISER